ncbi:sensor domain-containing diguanylate cyclase [Salinimonas marina]|uniref:Sensor domain-containing diguanylate cyclase n=1 Tax=Salinimonas marina TaxID=2785918 RepID=A0A7S9HDQ5_9ALTE|nr:sensor domain-containing diguanylate cyclase [Salinimonas marina]QPG06455.1 sensor domain-containing diguanylate cyclase [Salinimonas marina]
MIAPEFPKDEAERLNTLHALKILDTEPEERFDRITRMAKRMFGVPVSLVSLVDIERQWFKSAQGLDVTETPRDISFCGHAILSDDVFCVPNALEDIRFHDNPLVTQGPEIRFYAASPLKAANGHNIGTLCLIDTKPHELEDEDIQLLKDLAVMVEQEIAAMQLATLDELTLISNRRGFNVLANYALHHCQRLQMDVTVLMFDLNHFKPINDQFGHAEGDRALVTFANLLKRVFRESDVFARLGGDEFVVLLTGTDSAGTRTVMARFAQEVEEFNRTTSRGYDIEYSVGLAHRQNNEPIDAMLARADAAMYANKKATRSPTRRFAI